MRRTLAVFCVLIAPLWAETMRERGKRVVDEALEALGGIHFQGMQDRTEAGRAYSFYHERLSGLSIATIYTRYLTAPANAASDKLLVRERQSFGKEEKFGAVLFTDDGGYEITFRGARPLPKDRVDRYNESTLRNIFYILRERMGEPEMIFESRGADVFENQPVEIVNIIDSQNREVTVYFHKTSKLPVRQVYYRRDPVTKERFEEETRFSKYRDVGNGVQWPFAIQRTRDGEKIFEMYAESVAINNNLADNLFLLPSGMKMLKPAQ